MQIYGYFAKYPVCHLKKLTFLIPFKEGGTSGVMPPSTINQGRTEEAGEVLCPNIGK